MTVAERLGPSLEAVLEQNYALTLWAYLQLRDGDRMADVLARMARLDQAQLVGLAVNAPKELQRERRDITAELSGIDHSGLATRERALLERVRAARAQRDHTTTASTEGSDGAAS